MMSNQQLNVFEEIKQFITAYVQSIQHATKKHMHDLHDQLVTRPKKTDWHELIKKFVDVCLLDIQLTACLALTGLISAVSFIFALVTMFTIRSVMLYIAENKANNQGSKLLPASAQYHTLLLTYGFGVFFALGITTLPVGHMAYTFLGTAINTPISLIIANAACIGGLVYFHRAFYHRAFHESRERRKKDASLKHLEKLVIITSIVYAMLLIQCMPLNMITASIATYLLAAPTAINQFYKAQIEKRQPQTTQLRKALKLSLLYLGITLVISLLSPQLIATLSGVTGFTASIQIMALYFILSMLKPILDVVIDCMNNALLAEQIIETKNDRFKPINLHYGICYYSATILIKLVQSLLNFEQLIDKPATYCHNVIALVTGLITRWGLGAYLHIVVPLQMTFGYQSTNLDLLSHFRWCQFGRSANQAHPAYSFAIETNRSHAEINDAKTALEQRFGLTFKTDNNGSTLGKGNGSDSITSYIFTTK